MPNEATKWYVYENSPRVHNHVNQLLDLKRDSDQYCWSQEKYMNRLLELVTEFIRHEESTIQHLESQIIEIAKNNTYVTIQQIIRQSE